MLLLGNTAAGSSEDDVEVHAENTGGGIVLDAKINVLLNTEAEVAYRLSGIDTLNYNFKIGLKQHSQTRHLHEEWSDQRRNSEEKMGTVLTFIGEILSLELVLLDLQGGVEQVLGLLAADGHVDRDFRVSLYRESTDGVAGT